MLISPTSGRKNELYEDAHYWPEHPPPRFVGNWVPKASQSTAVSQNNPKVYKESTIYLTIPESNLELTIPVKISHEV